MDEADDEAGLSLAEVRRLAASVDRAATWLPFTTKCLPRAVALSWILKREQVAHTLIIAVRPERLRGLHDDLHAWVEIGGVKVIGDLPGPWLETLRLGSKAAEKRQESS